MEQSLPDTLCPCIILVRATNTTFSLHFLTFLNLANRSKLVKRELDLNIYSLLDLNLITSVLGMYTEQKNEKYHSNCLHCMTERLRFFWLCKRTLFHYLGQVYMHCTLCSTHLHCVLQSTGTTEMYLVCLALFHFLYKKCIDYFFQSTFPTIVYSSWTTPVLYFMLKHY